MEGRGVSGKEVKRVWRGKVCAQGVCEERGGVQDVWEEWGRRRGVWEKGSKFSFLSKKPL